MAVRPLEEQLPVQKIENRKQSYLGPNPIEGIGRIIISALVPFSYDFFTERSYAGLGPVLSTAVMKGPHNSTINISSLW